MSETRAKPVSRWRAGFAVALALALLYCTFELGRMSAGYSVASSMKERIELGQRNRRLDAENATLQQRATTAEVAQRVDRQAQTDVQRMMSELQAETARQQQELQFYRGLAVRQFGSGTLRVQELQVRAGEGERRYRVLITIVQAATRDTLATGNVTFRIEGRQGKEARTLSLEDVEPAKRRQLPFSLRFFQQIEVPIELPLEFEPASLQVEYRHGRDAEPMRQNFNWRVEGETETPVL